MTFEATYLEHYDFVWRTLCRMGIAERDAEDECQKVFLIAHRRLVEFEGRSSLRTWLCGIALRVAAAHRRSSVSRREILSADVVPEHGCDAAQLQQLEERERLAELDAVLAHCGTAKRRLISSCCWR